MCKIIEPEFILTNLFASGKDSVGLTDLAKIRASLENEFGGIYVDVTASSVFQVVKKRPDLYRKVDENIEKTNESAEVYNKYASMFNNYISTIFKKSDSKKIISLICNY